LSHPLPIYLKRHPFYDRLPERISKYVHNRYDHLICIDVGANIGGFIAAFYKHGAGNDRFLAIEPNKTFNKYLFKNYGGVDNVKILTFLCSSQSGTGTYKVLEGAGTASIVNSDNGTVMEIKALDDIVADNPEFLEFNVLKVDTDGHDFEVIAGAKKVIASNLPIILLECDAFSNTAYVEDCLKTLRFFRDIGYNFFLLYDNFGYLMGKYPLIDLHSFRNLLFYQLTSDFYYFDILLMKDEDVVPFYTSEVAHFVDKMPNETLRQTAKAAAEHFAGIL
jgi:FkbM family methyltransferase